MSTLVGYATHFKDPTYDRRNNPLGRSVAELSPVAVSWSDGNRAVRIDFPTGGIACPLADSSGVAIVEDSGNDRQQGRAYVVNIDGPERFVLAKPSNAESNAVFSDVYYVDGILSFFLIGPHGDRRIECDAATGQILSVHEAR
jgi:hypothetical protein